MSDARIQQAVNLTRKQLVKGEKAAVQSLESAYNHILSVLAPMLGLVYSHIKTAQYNGQNVPVSWLYERSRLSTLLGLVATQMQGYGSTAQMTVAQLQQLGIHMGQISGQAQLRLMVPAGVGWTFGVPSPKAIMKIVAATQAGTPLSNLFAGFGEEAAKNVKTALIAGIVSGDNPRAVATAVQQALDVSRWRSLTIARTEMLRAYRSANLETFRANSDVVSGWIWMASLDPRTCAACIAMHGTEHDLTESMETHPNCRCVQAPKTKRWSAILGKGGDALPDTRIQVGSGISWFEKQSPTIQQSILGNAKYKAYANGEFTLKDIVGYTHDKQWGGSIYEKPLSELTR